ncbi:unnamed protein product [Sphagnum jensenii]|uniref:Protein kinase domain-containing protein n=1 Tax=Sphagnum jensenii TaxID=128206 RepID=A0ABP0XH61_9BRYO
MFIKVKIIICFHGILANGVEVAIKQLFMKNQKNIDEFLNEIVTISGVKHRNLVKLKGCCLCDNKKLLVYEYLENGDLTNLLFGGQNGKEVLFWPTRFNICLGIARGLQYLHDTSQPRIIHRDIKASNIFLDKMLQPKIADFGLAILFPDDKTHITTMHVAGTTGYLAPEYATVGQLTVKVDVYSFGVLLLEIISGRKNIDDNLALEDKYLVEKAWRLHREGNLINIVDQNLHLLNEETIQAQQLLNITLLCLLNDGESRPSMARVVAMLQGEVDPGIVERDLALGRSNMKLPPKHEVQPTIFGYTELKIATRDFHPSMKLGEGSFGVVYKGIFANGIEVAIKQLFMKTQKNIDEFFNEVVTISGVKHRNLVKLKGCCLRDNKKLLVYEYLENGDLTNLLFGGQNGKEVLFWPTRFNICLGIARGLHYLHDISQPQIIHRDIKASNILLDKMLQPKIADFGLAFLFPDDKTHITTMHVAGTKGYLAPEYATLGQLTVKVDVYSFGVLLLQIISGRKNIDDSLALEDKYLVEKAWRLHREGNSIDIVDQNLHLLNDETIQAQQLLNITLLCLLNDGEMRPSMARVVAMLQGEVDSRIVENDLALGRSNMKLPPSSLFSLQSELELSNISQGSETSSLVLDNHSNARSQAMNQGSALALPMAAPALWIIWSHHLLCLIVPHHLLYINALYFVEKGRSIKQQALLLCWGSLEGIHWSISGGNKLSSIMIDYGSPHQIICCTVLTRPNSRCLVRLRTYKLMNTSCTTESGYSYAHQSYLQMITNVQLKQSLSRFKCSNHRLEVECGKHAKPESDLSFLWLVSVLTIQCGWWWMSRILDDASIVGTLPTAIGDLTNLVILSLTRNPELTGPIPAEINNLAVLQILDLHDNNFNGTIPDFTSLGNLQELDLSGNQLTGGIPNFGSMKWLQTLKLSGNQLYGQSPVFLDSSTSQGLANLMALTTLNLSMNQFGGPMNPASIFNPSSNLKVLDLSRNNFSGPLPNISLFSTSLQQLNLSMNNFDGPIDPALIFNPSSHLKVLDLSRNNFNGPLPNISLFSTSLQQLNLDNNNFNGTLYIGNISSLRRKSPNGIIGGFLQSLNLTKTNIAYVDYNSSDITDVITTIILENSTYCLETSLQTNGQRCYCAQNCFVIPDTSNKNTRKVIIISTIVSGIVLILVISITTCLFWKSRQRQRYLLLQLHERFAQHEVQPTIFGYTELKIATRDFHPSMKLGEGSFGVVYKGILANGVEVAIKQLFMKPQKNIDEFLNEVVTISGVKHRNLVKLKGCCLRDNKKLLVYEYLENGDLTNLLFGGQNGKEVLFWPTRFNICLGIARGLHYLHDISQPRIIHRDIKASNILLDKMLQPKIADFGLAFLFPDDKTHITTMHVAGTK